MSETSTAAQRMFPSASDGAPAAAPAPQPATPAPATAARAQQQPAEAPQAAQPRSHWGEQRQPVEQPSVAAALPPEPEPIRGVDTMFNAPLRAVQDVTAIIVQLPEDADAAGFATDDAARAERQGAAEALHDAGLSRAEVEAAHGYMLRAAHPSYRAPDPAAAAEALKREFGNRYDDMLNSARTFYNGIIARPGGQAIKRFVDQNGLHSDPGFIKALAAAGKRRAR
jgi:uncharacterized protein YjiS (DUF1127 family)